MHACSLYTDVYASGAVQFHWQAHVSDVSAVQRVVRALPLRPSPRYKGRLIRSRRCGMRQQSRGLGRLREVFRMEFVGRTGRLTLLQMHCTAVCAAPRVCMCAAKLTLRKLILAL